jgi:hypothetical protein
MHHDDMTERRPSTLLISLLLALGTMGCASAPPPPVEAPPPTATPATTTAAPAPTAPTAAPASTTPAVASPAPVSEPVATGPTACPTGMKLVEGDYCTKVEHKCEVEWYAPQNKKRVCEKFAQRATCVGKRVKKRFCIDTYSWPNEKGVRPEVMNTFFQAQVKCAAMGKRMCTESEWNFACEGPEMKPFPHGYVRDPRKCNGDHKWDGPRMKKVAKRDGKELARLWRGVPSGSQPECVSDFGVADLPANNDEVVINENPSGKFSSVHTGGPWYSGVRNQCRPKVYTHGPDFYYYFLGFRCCANPDRASNEGRTPKQIAKGRSFEWVERMAGFTVEQMKQVLERKRAGTCQCQNNKLEGIELRRSPKYLCKTMCGTLLAPGAKDGEDSTRLPNKSRRELD